MASQGGPLGCDATYRVVIADRCRGDQEGAVRAEFTDVVSLGYDRPLSAVGVATIVLQAGCCEELREARQGRELILFRNNKETWRGDLLDDPSDCRSTATITAYDRWGILDRRLIHKDLCFRSECDVGLDGAGAPPLTIARALIEDGYAGDDRCQDIIYLGGAECGSPIEREYGADSDYTMGALNDLAKSQIDYTAHGSQQIVMCRDYPLGQTATLNCSHFASDVCSGSGGLSSATRVVVIGDGVKGEAGGVDPYYGLLETRVEDYSIKTTDAAEREARARLRSLRPPVGWVDAPDGSQLTNDAPVSLEELVPGVLIPVQLDCACTPLSEVMRLTDVKVTYGSDGEKVAITLVSLNYVGNDGETADGPDPEQPGGE